MDIKQVINYFETFLQNYFKEKKYFAVIYGSYANGEAKNDSDVDIFIAVEFFDGNDYESIKNFMIDFHKENHIPLDEEVPYSNKLLATYVELEKAVNLLGLELQEKMFFVPKIIKNKKFLESTPVKFRLLFNALTSPHIVLGSDKKQYSQLKQEAERCLFFLCFDLLNKTTLSKNDFINILLKGKNGDEGEMYLGYKKTNLVVIGYLEQLYNKSGSIFTKNEVSQKEKGLILNSEVLTKQKNRYLQLKLEET